MCDEATSSLDSRTEVSVMQSLRELAMNRTCIFIAHRLSTIMHCDRIYVMKGGKVCESGTHAELTEKRGIYYSMWKLQQEEVKSTKGAEGDVKNKSSEGLPLSSMS